MTKKDQRQLEWSTRIADYKASGLTMTAWCTANQVALEQFKYWKRKLKPIASDMVSPTASFIPISVAESVPPHSASSLVVHVGHASITLQKGFDPQLHEKPSKP
ncbi:IS66 family insertion sequence element accessory protein TnpB [Paenibacillus alkaliterrae]|uniref:IS66 family insertion sequence element accessory protein TnpA n=1 Tax=Paenibacillus alkaliterrae TaxID=320909 RepID=UPI001F28E9CE|nr:IS66 family insertion sequence element accessory protein TnpB [Paenibacillus alkaliterrae]MCF2937175.1 IS66 family insertion sequence element accessory protein TnpB [Paenibacillus alkaliterrae]